MKKKKSLFNHNWSKEVQASGLINQEELFKLNSEVGQFLEMKKCKVCNERKIIYYFTIDEKNDKYKDICIECFKDMNVQIICKSCGEKKYTKDYYTIRDKGYTDICKDCIKKIFIENSKKNVTKRCKKCEKELPATNQYFKPAGHYKDFLENKCRKCRNLNYLNKDKT